MGRGLKILAVLIFVGVLFADKSAWNIPAHSPKAKSLESYWAETQLKKQDLDEFVQDYSCHSSLRYFLACVNAVSAVLGRVDQQLVREGTQLRALSLEGHQELTERQLLEPWRKYFLSRSEGGVHLNFEAFLNQAFAEIQKNPEATVAAGLNGFLSIFRDPHTYIVPVSYYHEVISKSSPKTRSLGLVISRTAQNFFIRKIYYKSPAHAMGLMKGDVLIAINDTAVEGLSFAHVNELMRAEESLVKIKILRGQQKLEFNIPRQEVEIPSVTSQLLQTKSRKVGLLSINKFSKNSCDLTERSLRELTGSGMEGLILDLRDNSGGQIEEAACIAGLFLGPQKKLFSLNFFDLARSREETFSKNPLVYGGAMAILINRGSASASELLAGALRDHGRSLLVGEATFGKGTFQEGEIWNQNPKIALFSSRGFYILPSGFSPQMYGLEPDIQVNFMKDTQPREIEQYMYSLYPPSGPHFALKKVLTRAQCSESRPAGIEDLQLSKAAQMLFCLEPIIGAGRDSEPAL